VIWAVVIFAALLIPLSAVILDSPVLRAWAERGRGGALPGGSDAPAGADVKRLAEKVEALEAELDAATREIAQLKEGQQFFQRLLEDPTARQAAGKLPKPQP
jgi:hypothetical protein